MSSYLIHIEDEINIKFYLIFIWQWKWNKNFQAFYSIKIRSIKIKIKSQFAYLIIHLVLSWASKNLYRKNYEIIISPSSQPTKWTLDFLHLIKQQVMKRTKIMFINWAYDKCHFEPHFIYDRSTHKHAKLSWEPIIFKKLNIQQLSLDRKRL